MNTLSKRDDSDDKNDVSSPSSVDPVRNVQTAWKQSCRQEKTWLQYSCCPCRHCKRFVPRILAQGIITLLNQLRAKWAWYLQSMSTLKSEIKSISILIKIYWFERVFLKSKHRMWLSTCTESGEPEPLTASRRSQLCLHKVFMEMMFLCRHAESNSK